MREVTKVDWVAGGYKDRARKPMAQSVREFKQRQRALGRIGKIILSVYVARGIIDDFDAWINTNQPARSRSAVITDAITQYMEQYENATTATAK